MSRVGERGQRYPTDLVHRHADPSKGVGGAWAGVADLNPVNMTVE
jgi:hypothetical protein